MARKRFNHSKLKVVGKKRKLWTGDWFNRAMTNLYQDSFYDLYGRNPIGQVGKTQHVQVPEMLGYPYHAAARRADSNRPEVEKDFDILPDVAAERGAKAAANAAYGGALDGTAANQLALYKELSPGYKDAFGKAWGEDKYIKKVFTEDNFKKNYPFWKNLGKGIKSIASKTSSADPQDPSNAFFGGKYVAGVELGANLLGKKYDRGVKGAQTVNAILDVLPLEQIKVGDIPVGAIGKAAGKDLAALAQQAWGYKYNDENIAKVEDATAAANNNTATYNNYDAIMDANFNHAFNFSNKYIGDQGWWSHGIDDKAGELRLLSDRADKREHQNLVTSIDQTSNALKRALDRNWTAYGGRLRRPRKFVEGGAVINTGNPSDIGGGWFSDMGNLFSKGWFQHAGKGVSSMFKSGQLNDIISAAGDFAYKGLSGGMNTNVGVGSAMNKLGGVATMVPGPYGAVASAALKTVGGLTNRMFGSKLNYENINEVKGDIAAANANTATLNDYDSIMNNNWNNANYVSKSYIGKDGWFSNKANKTWRNLMTQVGRASDRENLAQAVSTEQVGLNTLQGLERQWYAEGGDLQSPRTAIDAPLANRLYMNKAANNVRRAANAMGLPVMSNPYINQPYAYGGKVNKFDGTEDSWLLGGVGISADRTGKPLGYMVQKNYDPSSYEYNALGKIADQYISRTGSRTDEQYAIKDAQKVKETEEAKRNYNRSQSAFNGYELTDQFNKHVAQPIAEAVAGGAGGLWNEIKDKPVLMMTGDPSISYAGNAYYRTPAEQAQDVGNFFNHTVVGNALKGLGKTGLGVLTPSQDLGVLTGVDNAIRNRDWHYLTFPGAKNNYGLARYPGDKNGETLNMMADIPFMVIGGNAAAKTAGRADDVVRAANAGRTTRAAQTAKTFAADASAAMVAEGPRPIVRTASPRGSVPAAAKQKVTIDLSKMTPDERLQAGINPKTGSLYGGYMDAMYNMAGARLSRGIKNPEVGYWDVSQTPIFSVNLDDPRYWRILRDDIENLKNSIDRSLFENPSVVDTWTPVGETKNTTPTAISAFFKTDQGKKFEALAEKYGLAPDEVYKVAERSIKEIVNQNSHAWHNYIDGKYMPYITLETKQASNAQRVSWGDRLYNRIRNIIKRHEQGHVATHTTATEMPSEVIESLSSFYKYKPRLQKYFAGKKGTEVAQRFSQVKDLYLLKSGENLTWDQFLYGLENYKKLTGYDNNMTDLYKWAVTVKDPKLQNMILGHFNNPKNAYNIVGPLILTAGATGATAASQAEGGSLRAGLDTALNN